MLVSKEEILMISVICGFLRDLKGGVLLLIPRNLSGFPDLFVSR